jgi:hypothetical protein
VTYNLLDDSLSADLAADGALTDGVVDRFLTLGQYAASTGSRGRGPTPSCLRVPHSGRPSEVKERLSIPVLRPNEAAFEAAVDAGSRIGLIVTFEASLHPLQAELEAVGKERGRRSRSPRRWLRVRLLPCRLAGEMSTTACRGHGGGAAPTWMRSC